MKLFFKGCSFLDLLFDFLFLGKKLRLDWTSLVHGHAEEI